MCSPKNKKINAVGNCTGNRFKNLAHWQINQVFGWETVRV